MAASGGHQGTGGGHIIDTSFSRDKRNSLFVQGIGRFVGAGMPFAIYVRSGHATGVQLF
jgi:hypothetical protein